MRRRCARLALAIVAGLILLGPRPCEARRRRAAPAAPRAVEGQPSAEVMAQAKARFSQGEKLFSAQQYAEAIAAYQSAHELWPLDGFLFNIAQCHRNLGNRAEAIDHFERYLKSEKPIRNRAEVERVVVVLRKELEESGAKPAVPLVDPEAEARAAAEAERARSEAAAREQAAAEAATRSREEEAAQASAKARAAATAKVPTADSGADPRPIYKRPYFWIATGLGVVVVGAGIGAIVGGTRASELPAGGTLGVVDWR